MSLEVAAVAGLGALILGLIVYGLRQAMHPDLWRDEFDELADEDEREP